MQPKDVRSEDAYKFSHNVLRKSPGSKAFWTFTLKRSRLAPGPKHSSLDDLPEVTPKKAYVIKAGACEKQCAHIRIGSVNAIKSRIVTDNQVVGGREVFAALKALGHNDDQGVFKLRKSGGAWQVLGDNGKYQNVTLSPETIASAEPLPPGIAETTYRYLQSREGKRSAGREVLLSPFLLVTAITVPPSLGNWGRHAKTEKINEMQLLRFFTMKGTPEVLPQIKKLKFTREGLLQACEILHNNGVNIKFLEDTLCKKPRFWPVGFEQHMRALTPAETAQIKAEIQKRVGGGEQSSLLMSEGLGQGDRPRTSGQNDEIGVVPTQHLVLRGQTSQAPPPNVYAPKDRPSSSIVSSRGR